MKILYLLSRYVSHLKAGREYIKALRSLGVEMVNNPETADVVIIHDEPPSYPLYLQKFPTLKNKYTIAYAVWETNILPDIYIEGMNLVNEIWTCSGYTHSIFSKYFDNVRKVPHVVSRHDVNPSDISEMKGLLAYDPEAYYFYTIADSINPRKNLLTTVESFLKTQSMTQQKIFLVVKQYRKALPYLSSLPNVITIDQNLDDGAIHALHQICDCYVSSHCAEAWGLSISDAMSFGNLVVATGYSGNMEYMRNDNSFPVRYLLGHIKEEDLRFQPALLDRRMSWAYIDANDLIHKMMRCLGPADHSEVRENARKIAADYSHRNIASIIEKRLRSLFQGLPVLKSDNLPHSMRNRK
jgi:glycosyltransferase involved in cell wall biosynthesis